MEDVQCQPEATYLALNWSRPSGDVDACLVVAEKLAAGGAARLVFQANTSEDALLLPNLVPATSYRLSLTALGRNGLQSRAVSLVCTTSAEGRPFLLVSLCHCPHGIVPGLDLAPGALPFPSSALSSSSDHVSLIPYF